MMTRLTLKKKVFKVYILLEYRGSECKVIKVYKHKLNALQGKERLYMKSLHLPASYHVITKTVRDAAAYAYINNNE